MSKTAVVLALGILVAAPALAGVPPIRVYVFTAKPQPGAFAPADFQDRADSVKDIRRSVPTDFDFFAPATLTDDRDKADVVVEVLGREREADARMFTVHILVSAGTFTEKINGRHASKASDTGWGAAADDATYQLLRWVKQNEKQLLAARPPKTPKRK